MLDYLARNCSYAIFGDEDQSIYSFRYAHPEGISEFRDTYPGVTDYCLDECHRCPTTVVAMANHLIHHNHPPASSARLNPKLGKSEGLVHIIQWDNLDKEAQGLARFVKVLIDSGEYKLGDILILSPRRLIGYRVRDALREASLAAHSFYHEEVLETQEAKRAFTLLTLLASPTDRAALRYWLGEGSPTWNARVYAELRRHCEVSGLSPLATLEALELGALKLPHTATLVRKFKELRTQRAALELLNVQQLIDALFPENQDWASDLRSFALLGGVDDLDAEKLLERLRSQITQPELPEVSQFVRVMSLHKSKGLTSRVVIVAGCMQGLIPNIRTEGTPDEQAANEREQRRLFYVVLTRCTEVLLLSSVYRLERKLAHNMGVKLHGGKGEFGFPVASTFLDELGPNAPARQRGIDFLEGLQQGSMDQ